MPARRNSLGRYEKTELVQNEPAFNFNFPRGLSTKFILIILVIFMMSPWIFMIVKKKTISGISSKLSDFYDNNFSCNCVTDKNSTNNGQTSFEDQKDKKSSF
jgi:hypothetical protein